MRQVVPLTSPTSSSHAKFDVFTGFKHLVSEIRSFQKDVDPDFSVQIIPCGLRSANVSQNLEFLHQAFQLKKLHPDIVVGFDIVSEEDPNLTNLELKEVLDEIPQLEAQYGIEMSLLLHSGESNSPGDENVIDAILQPGLKRIGHGTNLFLFPEVEQMVKERDIAVEICPISNRVLQYVPDLRFHPAAGMLKRNVQLVISPDDPTLFGYYGMTYDLWMAAVAWRLDLQSIKKLLINSIHYSSLSDERKTHHLEVFDGRWNKFITSFLQQRSA
jgi:adenosine deaminase CECR1